MLVATSPLLMLFLVTSQVPEADPNPNSRAIMVHPGDTPTRLAVGHLANITNHLINNSLALSSRKTYSSAQARYLNFCSRMKLNPLPANQQQLILFAADLSQTIAYTSMRTYLAAVRHLHISKGYADPLCGSMQLELLMKGACRTKPGLSASNHPTYIKPSKRASRELQEQTSLGSMLLRLFRVSLLRWIYSKTRGILQPHLAPIG